MNMGWGVCGVFLFTSLITANSGEQAAGKYWSDALLKDYRNAHPETPKVPRVELAKEDKGSSLPMITRGSDFSERIRIGGGPVPLNLFKLEAEAFNSKYQENIRTSMRLGRFKKAVDQIVSYCIVFQTNQELSSLLFDALIQLRNRDDAFEIIVPSVNISEYCKVRASLATSLKGKIYPGQFGFCKAYVESFVGLDTWIINAIPDSERNTLLLSWIGCGLSANANGQMKTAAFYFENALRLDPENGITNFYLARVQHSQNQFRKAFETLKLAKAHCGGDLEYKIGLIWSKYQRDAENEKFLDRN